MISSKKSAKIIPWIFMVLSFLFSLIFIVHNNYTLMNSDSSSELILGKLLSVQNGIISGNWFYSTEIRVINVQILYKFFFMIFANNWLLVRLCSSAIMLILLVASYLFMMNSIDLYSLGLNTAWILLLPFSPVYGYMITYGIMYNNILILTFITVGLIFKLYDSSALRNKTILFIFIIICIISGLAGIRQAMVCFVPLFLTATWNIYAFAKEKNTLSINDIPEDKKRFFSYLFNCNDNIWCWISYKFTNHKQNLSIQRSDVSMGIIFSFKYIKYFNVIF